MKELQSYFTEKNILTIFFPGLLATYPIWLLFLTNPAKIASLNTIVTPLGVVLGVLLFLGIYGIGYFIKRLAIRGLEWHFDNLVEKKVKREERREEKSDDKRKHLSTFNKTWYDYLKTKCGPDKTPIIIGFYDTYIYSYHFFLTCIVALFIQVLLTWSLDMQFMFFSYGAKWAITGISTVLIAYLYRQSRASANEAHVLRCHIVALNNEEDKTQPDVTTPLSKVADVVNAVGAVLAKAAADESKAATKQPSTTQNDNDR